MTPRARAVGLWELPLTLGVDGWLHIPPWQTLEILESYTSRRFGPNAAIRIDSGTPAAARHAAMEAFNTATAHKGAAQGGSEDGKDQQLQEQAAPFAVLMTTRCFGLGTNLPTVRCAVVYDSDWHPRLDMQALRRGHRVGEPGQLPVFRCA